MSYDLRPKNKKIKNFNFSMHAWPRLLETGIGLVIGYSRGALPLSYYYKPDSNGYSPISNDGFLVTLEQAKIMSLLARAFVKNQRYFNDDFYKLSEQRQKNLQELSDYYMPFHPIFLNDVEEFADFSEKSGGFRVY